MHPRDWEGEELAVGQVEAIGSFGGLIPGVWFVRGPLVESAGRDDAATALEGNTVGSRGGDGLSSGIDSADAFDVGEGFAKEGYESPAH